MSTADTLRAEGRVEGRVEGRAEGEVKGAARTLVRLLTRRFTTVPDEVRARIEAASLEQLDIWSDRVLDAATLDDVFR
jgi:predicted transposase YdaD